MSPPTAAVADRPSTPSGVGLGFRHELAAEYFAAPPSAIRWMEIHPENYIGRGGLFADHLARVQEHVPLITHGLTQCVGSLDGLDDAYVRTLRDFLRHVRTPFHSEHLAWGNASGHFAHDLLPVPFSREAVRASVATIRELRDRLELPIAIENISQYVRVLPSEMSEIDFVLEVLEGADCAMLLDVNNVYVNATNFGFDPFEMLRRIPSARVVQLHVAGHLVRPDGLRIDTHAEDVIDDVRALVEAAIAHVGDVPILLERDGNHPPLTSLVAEVERLEAARQRGLARRS